MIFLLKIEVNIFMIIVYMVVYKYVLVLCFLYLITNT